jgi:hypothetical protein
LITLSEAIYDENSVLAIGTASKTWRERRWSRHLSWGPGAYPFFRCYIYTRTIYKRWIWLGYFIFQQSLKISRENNSSLRSQNWIILWKIW